MRINAIARHTMRLCQTDRGRTMTRLWLLVGTWLLTLTLSAQESSHHKVLIRLEITPSSIQLDGADARQQVVVTGHYADGSTRDLTCVATLHVGRPDTVRLQGGVLHGVADGS